MSAAETQQERTKLLKAFFYPLVFVLILWIIKMMEFVFELSWDSYGILPRNILHLPAIITMPLLHSNFSHLASNTLPLFILSGFIFYFYKEIAWKVVLWIYFLSGLWLWIGGQEAVHIGASALVYGFAAFLFFSGIFRRSQMLMTVSLIVIFLYGSLIWGFFPEFFPNENISWDGHLFGFIAGILMAVYYRNEGPKVQKHQWDDDDDESDNDYWKSDQTADKSMLDPNARPTHFKNR